MASASVAANLQPHVGFQPSPVMRSKQRLTQLVEQTAGDRCDSSSVSSSITCTSLKKEQSTDNKDDKIPGKTKRKKKKTKTKMAPVHSPPQATSHSSDSGKDTCTTAAPNDQTEDVIKAFTGLAISQDSTARQTTDDGANTVEAQMQHLSVEEEEQLLERGPVRNKDSHEARQQPYPRAAAASPQGSSQQPPSAACYSDMSQFDDILTNNHISSPSNDNFDVDEWLNQFTGDPASDYPQVPYVTGSIVPGQYTYTDSLGISQASGSQVMHGSVTPTVSLTNTTAVATHQTNGNFNYSDYNLNQQAYPVQGISSCGPNPPVVYALVPVCFPSNGNVLPQVPQFINITDGGVPGVTAVMSQTGSNNFHQLPALDGTPHQTNSHDYIPETVNARLETSCIPTVVPEEYVEDIPKKTKRNGGNKKAKGKKCAQKTEKKKNSSCKKSCSVTIPDDIAPPNSVGVESCTSTCTYQDSVSPPPSCPGQESQHTADDIDANFDDALQVMAENLKNELDHCSSETPGASSLREVQQIKDDLIGSFSLTDNLHSINSHGPDVLYLDPLRVSQPQCSQSVPSPPELGYSTDGSHLQPMFPAPSIDQGTYRCPDQPQGYSSQQTRTTPTPTATETTVVDNRDMFNDLSLQSTSPAPNVDESFEELLQYLGSSQDVNSPAQLNISPEQNTKSSERKISNLSAPVLNNEFKDTAPTYQQTQSLFEVNATQLTHAGPHLGEVFPSSLPQSSRGACPQIATSQGQPGGTGRSVTVNVTVQTALNTQRTNEVPQNPAPIDLPMAPRLSFGGQRMRPMLPVEHFMNMYKPILPKK